MIIHIQNKNSYNVYVVPVANNPIKNRDDIERQLNEGKVKEIVETKLNELAKDNLINSIDSWKVNALLNDFTGQMNIPVDITFHVFQKSVGKLIQKAMEHAKKGETKELYEILDQGKITNRDVLFELAAIRFGMDGNIPKVNGELRNLSKYNLDPVQLSELTKVILDKESLIENIEYFGFPNDKLLDIAQQLSVGNAGKVLTNLKKFKLSGQQELKLLNHIAEKGDNVLSLGKYFSSLESKNRNTFLENAIAMKIVDRWKKEIIPYYNSATLIDDLVKNYKLSQIQRFNLAKSIASYTDSTNEDHTAQIDLARALNDFKLTEEQKQEVVNIIQGKNPNIAKIINLVSNNE